MLARSMRSAIDSLGPDRLAVVRTVEGTFTLAPHVTAVAARTWLSWNRETANVAGWSFRPGDVSLWDMRRSGESREVTYLPTGWRVVGRGAGSIAERAAAAVERIEPGNPENTLYALQCTMDAVVRGRPAVERVLEALTDEIRKTWADCPRLARDAEVHRPSSRFGGLDYDVLAEPGREWLGEIVWRAVHAVVAGAPVTTRVLLEEKADFTRLSVRVTADDGYRSVRGYVGAGQVQPGFLGAVRRELPAFWLGAPVRPRLLRPAEFEDFVSSELESATRDHPLAVLSPLESGNYVVDPDDLAWDLLGRARLYLLRDHKQTFDLSDAVGDRRMSCYWGAARCYMPGWSRHDDPMDHPLLIADRLADPIMRATWLGEIGMWLGPRVELPATILERRASIRVATGAPVDVDASAAPQTAAPREAAGASVGDAAYDAPHGRGTAEEGAGTPDSQPIQPPDLTPLFRTMIDEVRGVATMIGQLSDEVERLRTISSVRSSSTSAIERRLARLEAILYQAFPDDRLASARSAADAPATATAEAPREDDEAPTLVEVVRAAAELHADALVLLDSASASAADSPYEDPERVRAILDAMARVARRRRDGVLRTSLREAFADLGIDYRSAIARNTSARLREQYRFSFGGGDVVEMEEHIVLGNTYDPRRCLRVHFSSRVPNEPRFVIGHVGRHLDVKTTS
ncbi:MAG: hypothetical protein L0271_19110 [Gemmatimonadetes bacterium]|nr:hypothetical protein [Gemmatimonadota bacterium]